MLDELVESAMDMMEHLGRPRVGRPNGTLPDDEGELIEGPERVTFVLQAPGYWEEDLHVSASEAGLEVKAPDFTVRRQLPPDADVSDLEKRYANGVLSVTIKKLQ